MDKTLLPIRIAFVLICAGAGWLLSVTTLAGDEHRVLPIVVGCAIGALVVLVDIMLKGFSLRGLSAMSLGIAIGLLVAHMFAISPLLEISSDGTSAAGGLDPKTVYLIRVALFVICPYLATVIAMRCKDEFNLVIPYVRFVPHEVDVPLVVVDARALIDGRIARLCEAGFMSAALVIPRFVQLELQRVAEQPDPTQQARGRRGLDILHRIQKMSGVEVMISDLDFPAVKDVDMKLIELARTLAGKIVTNARGGQSWHNYKVAFDVVPLVHGKPVWSTSGNDFHTWETIGHIGKGVGLEWGGDWKFVDFPHFQATGGLTLADLQEGKQPKYA